jgi:hypothetical protein
VHALILTWSFHDLRTEDYTAPPAADYVSLEEETVRLRHTLEGYGWAVHEFLIPMHRSVESLKAKLKQFCRLAADDTLLIIYYHGHGALDDDNELVFSRWGARPLQLFPFSSRANHTLATTTRRIRNGRKRPPPSSTRRSSAATPAGPTAAATDTRSC